VPLKSSVTRPEPATAHLFDSESGVAVHVYGVRGAVRGALEHAGGHYQ
jgi:hypothetical protein